MFTLLLLMADGSFVLKERTVLPHAQCLERLATYGNDYRVLPLQTGQVASCQPLQQTAAR